ncbi:MAG: class I SAM-dependent methyltransferase, partial [Methyloceanibacter sp.]|uniref:class I SAM-dependent methyltransferase n=1 Tax=Methyloceanibacter sp. TaxID=1965321 RepID=UPI003EDEDC1C
LYTAALAKLAVQEQERILEIGFGNGHEISRLLSGAPGLVYAGVEVSETMIAEAASRNAVPIENGQVTLRHASSSALPFSPGSFDKALALNTIYFCDDPVVDLIEIRRVLREGGCLVLGAIAPWSTKNREHFRYGFRFYDAAELTALCTRAGFCTVGIDVLNDQTVSVSSEMITRDYFIVAAK